ncbi:protein slit-like [Microplitis mediator]|uniref:protein slit-like n=1 Tax=Microplitis mediator TaxID=375433 RepID=UPI002557235D|nr:protein slit-like [Microplitis mediator]
MISVIYVSLIYFLAYLNIVDGKCTLAPLDTERHVRQPIAYVCIHGDLRDLNDVPDNVEWIEFTVSHLHYIPPDAFKRFTELKKLTFYNCELREINEDAFRGLNNLEWLIMSNTKMHVARASMFKHIRHLKLLTLDSVGLSYIEPEVFQLLSQKLESLNLRNNDLDCLPIDVLAGMSRLKTIRIDDNPWLCDCRSALENLLEKHKIKHEQESNDLRSFGRQKRWQSSVSSSSSSSWQYNETYSERNSHRVYDCMAVIKYPPLPNVEKHNQQFDKTDDVFYQNKIEWREATATSVSYLDRLPDEIGWIEIFDVHIPILKRYTFFRFGNSLRSIMLKNCGIKTIEPEAFAGLHKLERLAISGAQLTIVANYWFQDLTRLTDLILEHDSIETFEFGAFNHLRNLRQLDLRSNKINCLPLENLEQLRLLQRIEASENPWYCSCRHNLESWLIRNRIGYEISNSRTAGSGCINENDSTAIRRPVIENNYYNSSSIGRVRWSWGYEVHAHKPVQRPTTPAVPVIIETTSSPIANLGGCRSVPSQYYYHNSRYNHLKGLTYVCTQGTLVDLQKIPSNIETIIITNYVLHNLQYDFLRKFNGYLRRLEIRNCEINTIHNGAFASLYNLESLIIRDNNIETVNSDWFGRDMRNLRHLDLSKNNIARIENSVFDCLPFLTSIDISDNSMNCIGVEQLEKLRHLRELNVTGNPWTCLCATRLQRFIEDRSIYCPNGCLDSVLHNNGMSTWGGCHVDRPKISTPPPVLIPQSTTNYPDIPVPEIYTNVTGTCSKTHERTHYRCSNGDKFIINNIPSYVRSIEIYDSHIPYLPAGSFSRFTNLTELTIRGCSLNDIDPRAFHGLHKLEKLVITDNRLTVIRNSWFRDCKSLYWLDLSKNNLMEIQSGSFDNLHQLQYLNIEENDFQCIYTGYLTEQDQNWRQLPRLKVLEFGKNPLKWRCYQELRQFLEVRAIGYTFYKCPHDSKALVRSLLNEGKVGGTRASSAGLRKGLNFSFLVAIVLFIIY